MKRINVPMFQQDVRIYKGDDEKPEFEKLSGKLPPEYYGCHCENSIWISTTYKEMLGSCFHEAVHLVDWFIEHRLGEKVGTLESTTEIRAYMVQYFGVEIYKYCSEE